MNHQPTPLEGTTDQGGDFTLLDIATLLAENARLLTVAPLLCGALALAGSYLITPSFTANAQILTPQQQSGASALLSGLSGLSSLAGGALGGIKNPADQWVALLKSRTIADTVIDRFKLKERYQVDYYFEARKALERNTRFTAGKDGLIGIEVDDTDPKVAAEMANTFVSELGKLSSNLAVTEAGQRRLFFEQQLRSIKDQLTAAETALKESGINTSALKTSPEASLALLAQLKGQIAASDIRLQILRGRLTENSPEYKDASRELALLKQQLSLAEQKDQSVEKSGGGDYIARYRDFKYYEMLFEIMAKQYEIARADEAREGAVIQVVDVAIAPEWKSKPKRATIAIVTATITLIFFATKIFIKETIKKIENDPFAEKKLNRFRNSTPFRRKIKSSS